MNEYCKEEQEIFELIPEKFRDKEMCIELLRCEPSFIKCVPKEYLTKEVYLKLLELSFVFMPYVPVEFITKEMCIDFIKRKGGSYLGYIPENLRDEEICKLALNTYPGSIRHIPKSLLNHEIYELVISAEPYCIKYIPEEYLTQEMCNKAFDKYYGIIEYMPKKFITKEMCEKILFESDYSHNYFKYIPDEFKTHEMCKKVLSDYINKIGYVNIPDYIFNPELYDERLNNSPEEFIVNLYKEIEIKYKDEIESKYNEEMSLNRIKYIFDKMDGISFDIEYKADGIINTIKFRKVYVNYNKETEELTISLKYGNSLSVNPSQMLELLNKEN